MQQRSTFLDTLKGIGIILVVWGHCNGHLFSVVIYSVHIPLFLFLSGYFFKPKPLKGAILGRFKRLVLPYFVFYGLTLLYQLLIQALFWVVSQKPFQLSFFDFLQLVDGSEKLTYNVPLWFFICLFWVTVLYSFLYKYLNRFWLAVVVVAFSVLGYCINLRQYYVPVPYYLDSAATGLIFFYLGNQWHEFSNTKNTTFTRSWLFMVASGVVFVGLSQFSESLDIRTNKIESPFFVYLSVALAGIALCWSIAQNINNQPVLSFLGRNSMLMMCVHTPMFIITDVIIIKLMPFIKIDSVVGSGVRMGLSLLLCSAITPYLNRLLLKLGVT